MGLRARPVSFALAFAATLAACADPDVPASVPPTGVDLTTPFGDLEGWAEVKARVGEPPESVRLETYLDFWRQALDAARQARDPAARQEGEDGWWAEVERAMVSMLDAERAQIIIDWLEVTFQRRYADAGAS